MSAAELPRHLEIALAAAWEAAAIARGLQQIGEPVDDLLVHALACRLDDVVEVIVAAIDRADDADVLHDVVLGPHAARERRAADARIPEAAKVGAR